MGPGEVARLKQAVELGKWPDGRVLSAVDRATALEAVLAWEHRHVPETERTGYMPAKCASLSGRREASIIRFSD
jgi:uncharacterized protein YeaC (DUF1315 family)